MFFEAYEKFLKDCFGLEIKEQDEKGIKSGKLIDRQTAKEFLITNYIPRFLDEKYCQSFGFQWNKFRNLQHDSVNGRQDSYQRIISGTKWNMEGIAGKSVLECGCGPGRFTEVFLKYGADVVGIDMSQAIDVNLENSKNPALPAQAGCAGGHKNLLLIQADIIGNDSLYEKFDYVFCYGVIQHTPEPEKTFRELVKYLKPGGKLSVDVYRKRYIPTGFSTPKYIWRPIAKRIKKETLLKIINWYIPRYIKFDALVRKIPKFGCILTGLIPIPCWNYLDGKYSQEERIKLAILDTFDALSAQYDKPQTKKQIEKWLSHISELESKNISYRGNGIVINISKKCSR